MFYSAQITRNSSIKSSSYPYSELVQHSLLLSPLTKDLKEGLCTLSMLSTERSIGVIAHFAYNSSFW